jgi:translocation and assembly module TamB
LSGDWRFAIRLPSNAMQLPPLTLAQRLAGNGELHLRNSTLAGVPVSADFELGYAQGAQPALATVRADLLLGGNRIAIEGRGDPASRGDSDLWRIELKADTLGSLAPLLRLDPELALWLPLDGNATGTMSAQGRWPALQTEGNLQLSQLHAGQVALSHAALGWKLDSRLGQRADQPLSLQLDMAGLQLNGHRADNLHVLLKGTLADHHIDIQGALPIKPAPIVEQVLGIEAQSGTRLQVSAQGAWLPLATGGGHWRAQVEQLQAGSWDGSQDAQASASGWAEARDWRVDVQFDGKGSPVAVQADPGRIRLANTMTLRWDAVRIDLGSEPVQVQLHADIDAFALAPLLARAQPGVGWQGNLRLAARVDIRAAERLDADLVFERRDGDLSVASGETTQTMGLSEFKLSLAAHDGIWNFTQVLRGSSLGEINGQLRARTTPDRRWPDPQAEIDGAIQARVADIGIWSAWVPPGWRLVGELRTTARVSGRFGEPQFTGDLTGSGLGVRNLLQGVNVSDGQIAVKLSGDAAQIERFTFKGGDGTLSVSGGATLGSQPQARLQLTAQRFRLLGRIDRQAIVSGSAELNLKPEEGRLEGRFKLDEGLIDARSSGTPTLDDDVTVRRPGTPDDQRSATTAPGPRRNFDLALDLDLGEQLHVRGRGLDTLLRGQLRITNPAGRLAVNGTLSTDGGTYAAYGQKLDIERGIIAFSGPVNNPRLDVLALRPNIDTRVGVAITGNLLTLRVRLFSEPDMADTDKLSWLVLGRAPDGLGRNDTALLQRAAVALFAGEGEAPTDALLKSLGIDELSLRQGDSDVRDTVVTLGKQLSRRWYVGYERGVNATTGTWQLIYRIAQRFTLRAQSGLDNSLDIIWTWRFQETPTDAGMRKSRVVPP